MSYLSHSGANVPGGESSWERKFHGAKVPCNFRSRERKLHGMKVPGSESTRERKFHLWYFRSWERKYVGTKVPVTVQLHTYFSVNKELKQGTLRQLE